jgi:hypothetical protein
MGRASVLAAAAAATHQIGPAVLLAAKKGAALPNTFWDNRLRRIETSSRPNRIARDLTSLAQLLVVTQSRPIKEQCGGASNDRNDWQENTEQDQANGKGRLPLFRMTGLVRAPAA